MNHLRYILAIIIAGVFVVALAACGAPVPASENNPNHGTGLTTRTVVLPDGRSILCVVSTDGDAGGVSCDWESAK